ncbi:MAG: helix-turn-helix transcriptional regulator [Bacteroidetes bacterium]|nr:helix-turn-helix transcriptional regulator [Bacteroidota bacterium]
MTVPSITVGTRQYTSLSFSLDPNNCSAVRLVREIVLTNLREDLQISIMAELLGCSRVQLYRKLQEEIGISPSQFIRQLRLKVAYNLLLNTQWTVSQIAYSVGFNDPKYFSRVFRKQYKIAPSLYSVMGM